MAHIAYSNALSASSSGQFSLLQFDNQFQAARTRDHFLFSLTMMVIFYRVSILLSENYKLNININALVRQTKGQGAFFDSLLKDNKKLTEETKRMHSDKKNAPSDEDEKNRSQRKQEGAEKEKEADADQPSDSKKDLTTDSKDQVADNHEDKSTDKHDDKHKVTGKDENKTTNISENQEIKNIKAAHAEEVKSLTIVLEEVRKQLELEKKNTIKLEEKHKTELKDLREKLQDIQFLVGKDKSKED